MIRKIQHYVCMHNGTGVYDQIKKVGTTPKAKKETFQEEEKH